MERWLRLRDPWTRAWIERSTRLGIEAAREADVDLVYAWMQPYPSAEAAAAMRVALSQGTKDPQLLEHASAIDRALAGH